MAKLSTPPLALVELPEVTSDAPGNATQRPLTAMGERMEEWRERAGLDVTEAAAMVPTGKGKPSPQPRWSEWTRNDPGSMSVELVERIAHAMGVAPAWLLYGVGEGPTAGEKLAAVRAMLVSINPKMHPDDQATLESVQWTGRNKPSKALLRRWYYALDHQAL